MHFQAAAFARNHQKQERIQGAKNTVLRSFHQDITLLIQEQIQIPYFNLPPSQPDGGH